MQSKPPIFIVGSPRSGTTLLRNILNRHPAVAICSETRFYRYVYRRRRAFGDLKDPRNRKRLIEEYLSTHRIGRLGLDLAGLGERLQREATGYRELFASIMSYYAGAHGKPRYGEKTPQHAFFTETLCEWYPGATIIHLVRDPRDVVASLQRMPWAPDSILANAWMWLVFNLAARRSRHRPEYLQVRYEALVTQPEPELARICAHMDEDYAPSMLTPQEEVEGPYTWPRHARGPITRERLEKWKSQLAPEEVALTEWAIGREMTNFGYEAAADPPSMLTIARGMSLAGIDGVRRRLAEFPASWYHLLRPTKIAREEYWKNKHMREKRAALSGLQS